MSVELKLPTEDLGTLLRFLGKLWLHELDAPTRGELLGSLAEPWQSVGGALPKASLKDLQADFCQLLANPKTYVAPFQSVWQTGQLDGPSAQSMRRYLKETGYRDEYPTDEVPDHFGLQLDLAGWMLSKATGGVDEADVVNAVAAQFVSDHVRWGLHMLERAEVAAASDFYRGLIHVTRRMVEERPLLPT